jgi:heme exporter protein C
MGELGSRRWGSVGNRVIPVLVVLAAVHLVFALLVIFEWTPNDATLGFSQKIFYFHLPGAIFGYLGFGICCVASVVYLARPSVTTDAVARAGASTGLVFCAMVLGSGPLWAKDAWGVYWTGEPRLVLTLALFVIFLAYVLVRAYGGRTPLTRRVGAVLAIFGFADIPLVRYAVQKWGGNHPQVVTGEGGGIAPEMQLAVWSAFAAFLWLFLALFWLRLRVGLAEERLDELHLEIGDRELLLEAES